MTATGSPVEIFAALSALRPAVYRAWQRFAAEVALDDLTVDDCWLLLQLGNGSMPRRELVDVLAFFADDPQALVTKALARGWITATDACEPSYSLTDESRVFFRRVWPVAQRSNEAWRGQMISDQPAQRQLDAALAMLQGRQSPTD